MNNVDWKVDGDKLIIEIVIDKAAIDSAPPSTSGKTFLVASTTGSIEVPTQHCRQLKLQLNLMAKK